MTTDAWNRMKRAKEESYFEKADREAIEKLRKKSQDVPKNEQLPPPDAEVTPDTPPARSDREASPL